MFRRRTKNSSEDLRLASANGRKVENSVLQRRAISAGFQLRQTRTIISFYSTGAAYHSLLGHTRMVTNSLAIATFTDSWKEYLLTLRKRISRSKYIKKQMGLILSPTAHVLDNHHNGHSCQVLPGRRHSRNANAKVYVKSRQYLIATHATSTYSHYTCVAMLVASLTCYSRV